MPRYNAKDSTLVFGGVFITGFGEDSMIEAEKDEDNFEVTYGAQGDWIESEINNTSGTITVTLMQDSPSIRYLNQKANTGERLPIQGICGEDKFGGTEARVLKPGAITAGATAEEREFEIQVADYYQE